LISFGIGHPHGHSSPDEKERQRHRNGNQEWKLYTSCNHTMVSRGWWIH